MNGMVLKAIREGDAKAVAALLTSAMGQDTINESWRTSLACRAAERGQSECLRVLIETGVRHQDSICVSAADYGQLSCLRLAYGLGLPLTKYVATVAASQGHVDCLAFALEKGPDPYDWALVAAGSQGHVGCVELLVAHGLPKKPYHALGPKTCWFCSYLHIPGDKGSCGPDHLRCLQHLLDKRCPIDPGTLIWAARYGDVDCVRLLHSRGVPLWDCVWEENVRDGLLKWKNATCLMCCRRAQCEKMKVLAIPGNLEDANHMWKALMYGSVMGAPLPPRMARFLKAKRRSTRAVLLSIYVATRLSQGPGVLKQRAAWAAMSRMPVELFDEILVLAGFEIPESLRRRLCGEPPVRVRGMQRHRDVWVSPSASPGRISQCSVAIRR